MQKLSGLENDHLMRGCHWRDDNNWTRFQLPDLIKPWLCDSGSLTSALRAISDGTFRVELLSQRIALPFAHEQRLLRRNLHEAALIRKVYLMIYNSPVVFARSIIPLALAKNHRTGLSNLGTTPLVHLLFKRAQSQVTQRQFACIKVNQGQINARRTPYEYQNNTILVSEFFLPTFNSTVASKRCEES